MHAGILDGIRDAVEAEIRARGSSITMAEARDVARDALADARVTIDLVYAALETGPGASRFVVTRPPPRPPVRVGLADRRRP